MFFVSLDGQQIYKPLDDLLVIFNPKLTLEIGKAGSFEFDIPPNNPFYDRLNQLTTEVAVDMDTEEIFHGRVLSVERTFSNIRHVYCEGDLSYLIDSVQKGVKFNGTTHQLFDMIIRNHNARVDNSKKFMVGIVNIENRPVVITGKSEGDNINVGYIDYKQIALDSIADEWNNSFDYIQNCLIDYCGGYLRTRRENGTMFIDLLDDFGSNAAQPVELGKNILDLTEEIAVEDLFTVLIPLGDDNLTIAAVNGGSDELVDRGAVAKYGRIVRTHVFNNVNNAYTLLENARRFLATSVNVPRTITVRAVDLHLVNEDIAPIHIGDKVEIISYVHEVNDILMCTKIEYDLEHPENNNYTFGNPKQTLTQRYREDLRQSTSANSPSSAAAAGASAAAATAKETEKEKEKAFKDFYDAYIKENDEEGTLSLGALYKKYMGDRHVLINDCGIDFDAQTGNVNLRSLHNVVDSQGREIAKNTANIRFVQEDENAKIENVLERQSNLEGYVTTSTASITQEVSDLKSQINITAQIVSDLDDAVATSLADIEAITTDQEARITQTVEYTRTTDEKAETALASITMVANDLGSEIRLKADKTYVDGELNAIVGNFEKLTSGTTVASKLRATEIIAGSLSFWDSSTESTVAVPSMNHSHQLVITEGNDGNVEVRLGMATTVIPQVQSFNIANTRYFKDNVAANISLVSLTLNRDAQYTDGMGYRYETTNKRYAVYVSANMSNNKTYNGGPLYVNASSAYNAGKVEGQNIGASTAAVNQFSCSILGDPVWNNETQTWHANGAVVVVPRGTKADGSYYINIRNAYMKTISFDVTKAYNAGVVAGSDSGSGDVSIISLGLDPDGEVSYSSTVNNYYIPVYAQLSNGRDARRTLTVSATAAQNAVSISSMRFYTLSGETTVTYNSSDQTLNASVEAVLSNGVNYVRTVTIPADLAYSAGAQSVTATSIGLNTTSWSESSTGYLYETANHRFKVRLRAVLSNNRAFGQTIYIPAIDAHNAGVDEGAATAYFSNALTNAAGTPYWNGEDEAWYSSVTITGTARGTKADGTYYTSSNNITKAVDVTAVYEAAVAAGGNNVTLSSISLNKANSSDPGWTFSSPNFTVKIKGTLSNGTTGTGTVTVDATSQLQAATNSGVNSVTVSSVALDTSSSATYQTGYKRYVVPVLATASNGATKTGNVYVSATAAFDAGKAEGAAEVTVSSVALDTSSSATYQTGYKRYVVPVLATASNGATKTGNVYVSATTAFDAGKAEGAAEVTVSSVALDTSSSATYQTGYKRYVVPVLATASNGATKTGNVYVSATAAFDAGKAEGAANAVTSLTVSRVTGTMTDWVIDNTNLHVYVKVNLSAKNGSSVIKTDTGEVNVDDIVGFWSPQTGTVLSTTNATQNNTFDIDVNLEGYTNAYYTSGNYKYARIRLKNGDGNNLDIIRVAVAAGSSGTGTITLSKATTSSSVNPYYGTLTDYAWINNKHYCRIKAVATGSANSTQYYDINDIVNYAYELGGGGGSSVTVRSIRALTNKIYDSNLDMYYVQVRVTYTNGATQTMNAYYN